MSLSSSHLLPAITEGHTVPLQRADAARNTDCWNSIGVGGDRSCPELPKMICCRNCPVYSAAAVRVLTRPLTEDYRLELANQFARARKTSASKDVSVVLFRVQTEWFAFPTWACQEIAEKRTIHSLPQRGEHATLGLVNIRGQLLICVSLGRLLGLGAAARNAQDLPERLLVAGQNGNRLVFLVDEVRGPHHFEGSELQAPPAPAPGIHPAWLQGCLAWRGRTAGLFSVEPLFAAISLTLA